MPFASRDDDQQSSMDTNEYPAEDRFSETKRSIVTIIKVSFTEQAKTFQLLNPRIGVRPTPLFRETPAVMAEMRSVERTILACDGSL